MSTILQFYTRQTSSNSIFFLRKANTDRKVIESSIKPTSKIGTRLSNTRVNLSQPHSTRIANTKMDKVWVPCNGIPSTTFVVVLLIACAKKKSKKKEQAKKKNSGKPLYLIPDPVLIIRYIRTTKFVIFARAR